jgi:uncharacterized membrane protein
MASGVHFVAALGCGVMTGVFFAFSTFVMKALARLPASVHRSDAIHQRLCGEVGFLAAFLERLRRVASW